MMREELGAITGLRFVAAFFVFIFHIQLQIGTPYLKYRTDNIISHGALGVNLFFVLSGFLLTYSHLKDYKNPSVLGWKYYKIFLLKRVARIYPVYLCGLIIFLIITIAFNAFPSSFVPVAMTNLFMLQSFFPIHEMTWYGTGSWSVSTELFFYMLFPVFLPLLLRIKTKRQLTFLLIIMIVISSIPGIYRTFNPDFIAPEHIYAFAPVRLPEFLCGIVTGILVFKYSWYFSKYATLFFLSVLIFFLLLIGGKVHDHTAYNLLSLPAIIGLICTSAHVKQSILTRWLSSRLMKYLGKISYCFYISQLPIMFIIQLLRNNHIINNKDQFVAIVAFLVSLLISILLYHFIEVPIHEKSITRIRNYALFTK